MRPYSARLTPAASYLLTQPQLALVVLARRLPAPPPLQARVRMAIPLVHPERLHRPQAPVDRGRRVAALPLGAALGNAVRGLGAQQATHVGQRLARRRRRRSGAIAFRLRAHVAPPAAARMVRRTTA